MNLEDIAKKAGVSRSTVSRVINGEPYVSEKTRKKVLEVIEAVGFSPNPAARMLVTQRTNVIGVVMPHPVQDLFASDNPYYHATLLQGISDVVRDRGYAMLLWLSHPEEETQVFYRRILSNRLMDGLLIIATLTTERGLIEGLLESKTPFVLTSRPIEHEDKISYVTMDNVWAAQHAVQHLINLGRRHIATITGDIDNVDAQDRFLGYQKALRGAGIPIDDNLIAYGMFNSNSQSGYTCMKQILHRSEQVDAVLHTAILSLLAHCALFMKRDYKFPMMLQL